MTDTDDTDARRPEVRSLGAADGRAVLWGLASTDLNVNLVQWPAGEGVDAHVNAERDVLLVILAGGGTVTVDDEDIAVTAEQCVLVPSGTTRVVCEGEDGIRYMTVHRRRPPLTLGHAGPTG